MKAERVEGDTVFYAFACPGCGSEGDLGLAIGQHESFTCPEGCGALFVQWQDPEGRWRLKCVVQPVFAEAT